MAVLLMKLRYVPDDELAEIEALLEAHALDCYATSAGTWGISLPALWLVDASRLDEARALLDAYAAQRQAAARALHDSLREAGRARSALDMLRENPLRYLLYVAIIGALAWFSVVPFLHLN